MSFVNGAAFAVTNMGGQVASSRSSSIDLRGLDANLPDSARRSAHGE